MGKLSRGVLTFPFLRLSAKRDFFFSGASVAFEIRQGKLFKAADTQHISCFCERDVDATAFPAQVGNKHFNIFFNPPGSPDLCLKAYLQQC